MVPSTQALTDTHELTLRTDEDEDPQERRNTKARELGLPSFIEYTHLLNTLTPTEEMREIIDDTLERRAAESVEQVGSVVGESDSRMHIPNIWVFRSVRSETSS